MVWDGASFLIAAAWTWKSILCALLRATYQAWRDRDCAFGWEIVADPPTVLCAFSCHVLELYSNLTFSPTMFHGCISVQVNKKYKLTSNIVRCAKSRLSCIQNAWDSVWESWVVGHWSWRGWRKRRRWDWRRRRRKVERWRKRQSNCERERERMRDSLPLPHRKINIGNKGSRWWEWGSMSR